MASSVTGSRSSGIGAEALPMTPSEAEAAEAAAEAAAADLIYTDEQLPEIEIRELVSLYLLEHPFSVFTTQEVQAYIARLLNSERRAGLFASIHAELIHGRDAPGAAPRRPHPPQTRFPVLRNPRPDRSDEEPAEYLAADAEANANPSVAQRDAALDALSFPLEINAEALELDADAAARLYRPPSLPPHESAVSATTAGFVSDDTLAHTVRLFPKDARFPLIQTGTVFRRAATSAHQHLAERFAAEPLRRTVLPAAPVLAEQAAEALTNADEALEAALADLPALAALSGNNVDIHTLQALLDVYGLELSDITEPQFTRIVAAVTEFLAAEAEAEEEPTGAAAAEAPAPGAPSKASESLAATKPTFVASAPWEAYAAYLQRPASFEDRLGLYESFLQNPPAMPPLSEIPSRLADLARDIAQNRMSLPDVVAFLRILRARRTYDHISKRIKRYTKFAPDAAEIALAAYRIAWARLVAPSTTRSQVKFSLAADVAHVAAGQNVAGYDGNRAGVGPEDFAVAAPMGHGAPFTDTELAAGTTIGTFDIVAPSDITDPLAAPGAAAEAVGAEAAVATDDALWELGATAADVAAVTPESLGVPDMSPGTHELATWLLPYFQSIQKASGLPLDLAALAELWKARQSRLSTSEQWEASFVSEIRAAPGTSAAAAEPGAAGPYAGPLPFLDLQATYETIAAVLPPAQHALARAKAREIHAECAQAMRAAFLMGIAFWVIHTQRAAVARAFVFDVLSAHPIFIDKWSVYGPPLTPAAGAQREASGTLQYIAHVAADTPAPPTAGATSEALRFADATELFSAVLPVFREAFPEESAALSADWASYKAHQDSKAAKAKAAKESLRAALEARHVPRILREYIRTLLYLPGLLASGPAAGARGAAISGCCYQRITPDFRADTDWAQKEKNLANLKAVYGKKRLTQADREPLALPKPRAAAARAAPEPAAPLAPAAAVPIAPVPVSEPAVRVTAWLTALRAPEAAPIAYLPHALIGEILRDSRQALGPLIDRAIASAIRTSGTRYQTFAAALSDVTHVPSLLSLLNLLQTAYRRLFTERYTEGIAPTAVNERVYLESVQSNLRAFKAAWTDPETGPGSALAIYDERDVPLITRLFHYVIARALCGAAIPESAVRPLSVPLPVNATFMRDITTRMLKIASAALSAMQMPTVADQQAFITEEREKQKKEILDQYNDLTVEGRQLVLQMKKLGMAAETAAAMQAAGAAPPAPTEADDYREGLDYNYEAGQNPDEPEYD